MISENNLFVSFISSVSISLAAGRNRALPLNWLQSKLLLQCPRLDPIIETNSPLNTLVFHSEKTLFKDTALFKVGVPGSLSPIGTKVVFQSTLTESTWVEHVFSHRDSITNTRIIDLHFISSLPSSLDNWKINFSIFTSSWMFQRKVQRFDRWYIIFFIGLIGLIDS